MSTPLYRDSATRFDEDIMLYIQLLIAFAFQSFLRCPATKVPPRAQHAVAESAAFTEIQNVMLAGNFPGSWNAQIPRRGNEVSAPFGDASSESSFAVIKRALLGPRSSSDSTCDPGFEPCSCEFNSSCACQGSVRCCCTDRPSKQSTAAPAVKYAVRRAALRLARPVAATAVPAMPATNAAGTTNAHPPTASAATTAHHAMPATNAAGTTNAHPPTASAATTAHSATQASTA